LTHTVHPQRQRQLQGALLSRSPRQLLLTLLLLQLRRQRQHQPKQQQYPRKQRQLKQKLLIRQQKKTTAQVETRAKTATTPAETTTTWWAIIAGHPSAKWQNFVTVLVCGKKIPTIKHEIMLHAMSINLLTCLNYCLHCGSWQLGTNRISAILI